MVGRRLPSAISGTITDASGRTLSGQTTEAFWNLAPCASRSFGLNCALGAKELRQYVEELSVSPTASSGNQRRPAQPVADQLHDAENARRGNR
ncbi:MAG: hypothetical protein M9884_13445 [Rhodocyclaceae bacterium]|nr:hypothetical protein [Rhodocyclaceae bacterium]